VIWKPIGKRLSSHLKSLNWTQIYSEEYSVMVTSNRLRSNKRESFRLLEKKIQLLRHSLEQEKLVHSPSVSFKMSIQVFKRFKQLFYHQLESLLSKLKELSNLLVNSWTYLFIALQEEPTLEPKRKLFKKAAK